MINKSKGILVYFVAVFGLANLAACGSGSTNDNKDQITNNNGAALAKEIYPKIANGVDVPKEDFPFVNQFEIVLPDGSSGSCSSTFINSYQALTAAHCVSGVSPAGITLLLGDSANRNLHAVGIDIHPFYFPDLLLPSLAVSGQSIFPNDIAVITFDRPYDGPIVALAGSLATVGQQLLIAGYGALSNADDGIDGTLRAGFTRVQAVSGIQGSIMWQYDSPIESNFCRGDSGGPSFVELNGYLALIGVHSTISGGCELGGISADTMVSTTRFLDWITAVTAGDVLVLSP